MMLIAPCATTIRGHSVKNHMSPGQEDKRRPPASDTGIAINYPLGTRIGERREAIVRTAEMWFAINCLTRVGHQRSFVCAE
jgi:hypothetical protein